MSKELMERENNALIDVHRDLGRLEGRVGALEQSMSKIEALLTTIFSKLNEIKDDIARQKIERAKDSGEDEGEKKEKEKSDGKFTEVLYQLVVPVIVAAISIFGTVKFLGH